MKRLDLMFFEFFSNIVLHSPKDSLALLLENKQDKYRLYESVELTFSLTFNSILYNITFYEFNLLGGLSNSKVLNLES